MSLWIQIVLGCVAGMLLASLLWPGVARGRRVAPRRVVVTTVRGESYRGLLVRRRPWAIVLDDAEALRPGRPPIPLAGELEIRGRAVELVQQPPAAAVERLRAVDSA